MKLRLIDKLALYIVLALLIVFSAVVLFCAWGAVEPVAVSNFVYVLFASNVNKIFVTIACLIVIYCSARILLVRKKDRQTDDKDAMHKKGIVVDLGEGNNAFVTYSAIENTVIKLVRSLNDVNDCQCVIMPSTDGISIAVKLMLNYDSPVTDVSKQINQMLQKDIEIIMGIKVYGVKITVDTPSVTALMNLNV